jgi:hypothetical protein
MDIIYYEVEEAIEILKDEMGFCRNCNDHTPCGCEEIDEEGESE